jgi:hypothetical protein
MHSETVNFTLPVHESSDRNVRVSTEHLKEPDQMMQNFRITKTLPIFFEFLRKYLTYYTQSDIRSACR